jgi:hypothetical protein
VDPKGIRTARDLPSTASNKQEAHMNNILRLLKDVDADQVLRHLGLERRHPVQRASLSLLSIGAAAVAGLGVGLLLAPRSGADLRAQLKERWDDKTLPVHNAKRERTERVAPT